MATAGLGRRRAGPFHRFARPDDPIERTRWLFLLFGLLSLALVLPPTALTTHREGVLLASAACAVLAGRWCRAYLRRDTTLTDGGWDAVAIAVFTAATPAPEQVLGFAFSALWFRCLYGSLRGGLLRCLLNEAGMLAGLALWHAVPGNTGAVNPAVLLGTLPLQLVSVVIVAQLADSVTRETQGARLDGALAVLGTELLGLAVAGQIHERAWSTAAALCEAAPGLRVLAAISDDAVAGELVVVGAAGPFVDVPHRLDAADVGLHAERDRAGDVESRVDDATRLDALAGTHCTWMRFSFPRQGGAGWVVAGASDARSVAGLVSVRLLVNQVALALRNAEARDSLVIQASTDPLTGLANRPAFERALEAALVAPGGEGTAVLFVDLDDFKRVNDERGHPVGDRLLCHVAERLRRATRADDVCARLGGDEFAVLLSGTSVASALPIAERLAEELRAPMPSECGPVRTGASIGMAHSGTGVTDWQELVKQADLAMYAAKARGKGGLQLYDGIAEGAGRAVQAVPAQRSRGASSGVASSGVASSGMAEQGTAEPAG